jgi:hypothetical protein
VKPTFLVILGLEDGWQKFSETHFQIPDNFLINFFQEWKPELTSTTLPIIRDILAPLTVWRWPEADRRAPPPPFTPVLTVKEVVTEKFKILSRNWLQVNH